MQCPRCGKPIGIGAAFCPHCGQFLATPARGGAAIPVAASGNRNLAWAIGGTLLAVIVILFGLKAAGILQFGAKSPDGRTLSASGAPAPDSLGLKGKAPVATLEQPATNGPGMPDDVRRYLLHVERIEKEKVALASRMIAEMQVFKAKLGTFEGAEGLMNHDEDLGGDGQRPDTDTKNTFTDMKSRWEAVVNDFKSMSPPPQCEGLRDDYYRALAEIPGFAGDITAVLDGVNTDPAGALQKVKGMQGTSSTIDRYFGASDDDVSQICNTYNTRKWYDIQKDVGGGSLSLGGL